MKDQGGDNDEDNNDDDDNDGDDDDGDGDDDNSAKDDGGTDEGGNDEEESYSPADILSLSFTRFKIVRSNCYGVHVPSIECSRFFQLMLRDRILWLKGSSRCNDLSSTLLDWLVCVLYIYIYIDRGTF